MSTEQDLTDIPGTYVQDGSHYRKGYHFNMMFMSLNDAANREAFKADEEAYMARYPLTEAQRQTVRDRDWLQMLREGGNIYFTFKLAAVDGLTMQDVGAAMSGTGMTTDEFKAMMLAGGRPIDGNRSKTEAGHG